MDGRQALALKSPSRPSGFRPRIGVRDMLSITEMTKVGAAMTNWETRKTAARGARRWWCRREAADSLPDRLYVWGVMYRRAGFSAQTGHPFFIARSSPCDSWNSSSGSFETKAVL